MQVHTQEAYQEYKEAMQDSLDKAFTAFTYKYRKGAKNKPKLPPVQRVSQPRVRELKPVVLKQGARLECIKELCNANGCNPHQNALIVIDEIDNIHELFMRGYLKRDIASVYKVSRQTFDKAIYLVGVCFPEKKSLIDEIKLKTRVLRRSYKGDIVEIVTSIMEMKSEGIKPKVIAEKLGLSKSVFWRINKKYIGS